MYILVGLRGQGNRPSHFQKYGSLAVEGSELYLFISGWSFKRLVRFSRANVGYIMEVMTCHKHDSDHFFPNNYDAMIIDQSALRQTGLCCCSFTT